jgi:pyruvate/2-oxoglutarate dehydrogenase complex dihydrolipoamide dehydrogenase (E3) component
VSLDYNEVKKRVFEAQHKKEYHMKRQLDHLKIPVFKGVGKFITDQYVQVETDVDILDIYADNFIISTGSKPRIDSKIPVNNSINIRLMEKTYSQVII